jgi:uncharacterized membrane protein YebE (DUF533 family)
MFNAKQMLDQFMQAAQGGGAATANTNTAAQSGGGLGALLGNPAITGALSGVGGGLLAGLLLGNKKVRKVGGTVAAVGAAAGLGAIALAAYKNWQKNKTATSPCGTAQGAWQQTQSQGTVLDFDRLSPDQQQENSRIMLTVIVAAAKADGHFDERERKMIHDHIAQIGNAEAAQWAQQEIYKPLDVAEIARLATSPPMAAEIYLASLVIIDEQNERERAYLDALAGAMRLDPQLRREIEFQLAASNR